MTLSFPSVFRLQNRVLNFFFFICFAREIKGLYQISWGNEVGLTGIMYVFRTSWLKIKTLKSWDMVLEIKSKDYNGINIFLSRKTLVLFCLWKKTHFENQLWIVAKSERKSIYINQNNKKLTILSYMMLFSDLLFWLKEWRLSRNRCKGGLIRWNFSFTGG